MTLKHPGGGRGMCLWADQRESSPGLPSAKLGADSGCLESGGPASHSMPRLYPST